MTNFRLILRIIRVLWSSGILKISPRILVSIVGAWRRCGSSFAFLSMMAAIRSPSRVAIQDEEGCLTFAGLHQDSLSLAHTLSTRYEVGAGCQVAVVCHNHRGFVLALLAATRLGADVLPLGTDLPLLVTGKILKRQNIALILHDQDEDSPLGDFAPTCRVAAEHYSTKVAELPRVHRPGELIVLTSGTTGLSKGIRRRPTIGQLLPLVTGLLESIPIQMYRPIVLAIPLHHGYGIATLAMSLALGAPLQLARRFEIAPLLTRIPPTERPFLVTVPTLLKRWLQHPDRTTGPQVAAVVTGSAPLDPTLCTQLLNELGPVLFNLYGSSEAGLVALALPETLRKAPGCVGQPLPGNRVRLLDHSGTEVALGETGRILVKGPFVLKPGEDGWRETGDLGRLDPLGNLYICGRVDSMLVSGGENVYPHEVEQLLQSHESIAEVALLAVPDAEFGQRMVAAVVTRPNADLQEAQLKEWLRKRLERFKMPRRIHFLTQIPRNPLGKVDRKELLRVLGEEERG
jgi:acyl-CoA synthetase (AMP-forming)/AMP-acid ligase II